MINLGEFFRIFTVVNRLLARAPLAVIACWLFLTIGIAEVILVFALRGSLDQQLSYDGIGDSVIVFRNGMPSELSSSLDPDEIDQVRSIASSLGLKMEPQVLLQVAAPSRRVSANSSLVVRGMENLWSQNDRAFTLLQGRLPQPRLDELIVGDDAASAHKLEVGDTLRINDRSFTLVGKFHTKDVPIGNEVIGAASQIRSSARTVPGWSSVWIDIPAPTLRDQLAHIMEERLKDSVMLVDAKSYFLDRFRSTRRTIDQIVLAISVAVLVFTIAAYISSLGNILDRSATNFQILYLVGFARTSLSAGLLSNGAMLGMIAGLSAIFVTRVLWEGVIISLPGGTQSLTLAISVPLLVQANGLTLAILLGGVGALMSARKILMAGASR